MKYLFLLHLATPYKANTYQRQRSRLTKTNTNNNQCNHFADSKDETDKIEHLRD
jgi:hypothetical protein